MLTDTEALINIATTATHWQHCLGAYRRLSLLDALPEEPEGMVTIPAGEFTPATEIEWPVVWLPQRKGSPRSVRIKTKPEIARILGFYQNMEPHPRTALFCLETEEEFRHVIENDKRPDVRCAAIRRCHEDDTFFLPLALSDADGSVRLAAAKRLSCGAAMDTLLEKGTGGVQGYAAGRTQNLELLKAMALSTKQNSVGHEALVRVKDWSIVEIVTMLGWVQGASKGIARNHMRDLEQEWKASGIALVKQNQRLFAEAAINDSGIYFLAVEHITDEDCLADILCSLSPHLVGAIAYGPIGEHGRRGVGFPRSNPAWIHLAKSVLDRVHAPDLIKRISEEAKSNLIRNEAAARLEHA